MARSIGSQKTGGRIKGTPNRRTLNLQEDLVLHDIDLMAELKAILPALEADKRADILLQMMSFLYPKRKAIEHVEAGISISPQVIVTLPSNGREFRQS